MKCNKVLNTVLEGSTVKYRLVYTAVEGSALQCRVLFSLFVGQYSAVQSVVECCRAAQEKNYNKYFFFLFKHLRKS